MPKLSNKKIKSRKAVSKGTERKKSKKIVRGGYRKNTVRLISRAPSPRSPTRAAIEKKKTKKGGGAPPGLLLLKAVKSGNYNDVYELLEKGANPNYIGRDENGEVITPLIIACKNGNLEIIDLLVAKGVKINEKISGMSQIYRSILMDDGFEVIEKLIQLGANVNTEGTYGATPLSVSIKKQNFELVELLVSKGADVNQLVYKNRTPLSIACQYGHTEIVRFLKEKKAQGGC
jgi:ankyrin repeat protein